MKKSRMILSVIVLALLIGCFSVYRCCADHPVVAIKRAVPMNSSEERYMEQIGLVLTRRFGIPVSDSANRRLMEVERWNDEVITELYQAATPLRIEVSGDVTEGKMTLRYQGVVTDPDGKPEDYLREKTFAFTLTRPEDLFTNREINQFRFY